MKTTLVRFGSVAALAAGMMFAQAPAQTPAQPAAPGAKQGAVHQPFRQRMHQRMMQTLNLTPVQRDQAKSIFQKARQTAQPYRQQLHQNREALAVAVKTDDAAKIHQLAVDRGRLEGQMTAIRSEAAAKFYATLTPAQRAKADQMHQRFEQRIGQRWQQRTGPRTNG